jgi:hypothetical protein
MNQSMRCEGCGCVPDGTIENDIYCMGFCMPCHDMIGLTEEAIFLKTVGNAKKMTRANNIR